MKIINSNNIDALKDYPDNYFDAVVTDPPYGLGKEPDATKLMRDWIQKGYHEVGGSGFMGKEWDAFVPQPIFWKEVFRVLKHGGHVLSFFGTRTYDWGVMAMRFAGFEVRDCIQWLYGSGFPKSHNISKAAREVIGKGKAGLTKGDIANFSGETEFDITAPSTKEAKQWDGWGSALKPANEPIVLARKPLEKGLSIAENVLKWGTGAININGCRIGFKNEADYKESTQKNQHEDFGTKPMTNNNVYGDYSMIHPKNYQPQGRFPANLILTHHPECECKGMKKVKSDAHHTTKYNGNETLYKGGWKDGEDMGNKFADENGQETVEDWNCHSDCPIKILDEQSGESKSPNTYTRKSDGYNNNSYSKNVGEKSGTESKNFGDKGGASRFFYCAKASKNERNKGLDRFEEKIGSTNHNTSGRDIGRKQFCQICQKRQGACKCDPPHFSNQNPNKRANTHPTVKPIKLMQYLVRLITPHNGIVLDPFCGSGTTGIACKLEGFKFVGIEQDAEYCKIAEARIEAYVPEIEDLKETEITDRFTQLSLF